MKEHRFGLTRQAPSAYAKVGEIMPEPTAPDRQPGKGPAVLPKPEVHPGGPATPEAASPVPAAHDALRMVGTPEAATPQATNGEVKPATPEQTAKPQTLDEAIAENLRDVQDVSLRSRLLAGIKSIFKKGEKEERLIDEDKLKRWLEKWSPDVMTKALSEHPEAGVFTSAVYQARAVLIKKAIEQGANPFQMEMLLTPERIQELAKEHRVEQERYKAMHESIASTEGFQQAEQSQSETEFSQQKQFHDIKPREVMDIDTPQLRRYVKFANDVVKSQQPEVLGEAARMLLDALKTDGVPTKDQEIVQGFIDDLRQRQIELEKHHAERASDPRRDYRIDDLLGDVINDETGKKITLEDIYADRAVRDKLFDDLFAFADSQPHEFWQTAFNPLTQGQRHERFMERILQAKNLRETRDFSTLEDDHLREGFERYREKLEKRRLSQDDAREARGEARLGPIEGDDVKKLFLAEFNADNDRYQKEFQIRQNLHNASAFLYRTSIQPDQLYNYIRDFNGQLADIAHRFPGIRKMLDIYEQQVRIAMLEHNGYLRPEDIIGKTETETVLDDDNNPINVKVRMEDPVIEIRAKEQFKKLYEQGMIYLRDQNGNPVDMRLGRKDNEDNPRPMEDWELDRLITTSRGLMLANMRLLSLASESKLTSASRYGSYFLQDVLQAYSPNVHLNKKFFVPGMKSLGFQINDPDRQKLGWNKKIKLPWTQIPMDGWKLKSPIVLKEFQPFAFRKPWSVSNYWKRYNEYKKDTVAYGLKHPESDFNRLNPNRGGDAFTWLYDWKIGQKPTRDDNESFTRDFLEKGFNKMLGRYIQKLEQGQLEGGIHADYYAMREKTGISNKDHQGKEKITIDELRVRMKDKDGNAIKYVNIDDEGGDVYDEDVMAINAYIMQHGVEAYKIMDYDIIHDKVAHLRDELNEYKNWIGTGVRFEALRDDIDYGAKPKYRPGLVKQAEDLLGRIVDLQPDKIFLKSSFIQGRVLQQLRDAWAPECQENGVFNEKIFQGMLRETLENVNLMQEDLYKKRDTKIDEGETFYGGHNLHTKAVELDLNVIYNPHEGKEGTPPPAPLSPDGQPQEMSEEYQKHVAAIEKKKQQRGRVEQFMQLIKADFEQHKDAGTEVDGKPSLSYFDEFIHKREFTHGFMLWSGDMPVDELKMEAVGPTGAFARAAGDNLLNMKAAEAQNKLQSNLKNIRVPEDSYEYLKDIYSSILNHDGDLASQRMTEVAMMLMQWYGADWKASIPIVGGIQKWFGRSSMAQRAYGKRMPVWHAAEKRHLINFMKEKGYINDGQYKDLEKRGAARYFREVMADNIISVSQILALIVAFYILKKSLEKE